MRRLRLLLCALVDHRYRAFYMPGTFCGTVCARCLLPVFVDWPSTRGDRP